MGKKLGIIATLMSIATAVLVLSSQDNGRMTQEGVLFEVVAVALFVVAGVKGSRWWLCGPLAVVLFWVVAAHMPALWK